MRQVLRIAGLAAVLALAACGQQQDETTGGEAADGGKILTPVATIEVAAAPHGMRIEGTRAYIAAAGAKRIEIVDLDKMEVIGGFATEGTPLDLERKGDGWLIPDFESDRLSYYPADSAQTSESWDVGKGPSMFTRQAIGDRLYLVSEFADKLTVFDRASGEILHQYDTADRPYPADITADGVLAFVPARDAATVTVIDLLNQEIAAQVSVCNGPMGGALTVDEVEYLVACGNDNAVWAINTASFEVTRKLANVGARPFAVEVSPDGRYAFAINADGTTVSVIDLASFTVVEEAEVGQQPIVERVFGDRLYVSSEVSNSFQIFDIARAPAPATRGEKNKVMVIGTIHSRHETSEAYSLDVLARAIRAYDPDYWLVEIPPNRIGRAIAEFQATGEVKEPRTTVFPEYMQVMFPLSKEMHFRIIGTAGWNSQMNRYRNAALKRIANDPARAQEWAEHRAAMAAMSQRLAEGGDDPLFINSPAYDAAFKAGWGGPYDKYFNNDLGPGGWTNINRAHYANIARALDAHTGEGARVLITYGAGHKYWFLEQLKKRDDITLIDARDYFRKSGEGE